MDAYEQTLIRLGSGDLGARDFAASLVEVLPVNGASVAAVGGALGSETLSASNDLAAHLDELQFDFTEGPCWEASASGSPILEPRLPVSRWPNFSPAASKAGVASIFAFPLRVGPLPLGAIDLYSLDPLQLSPEDQDRAMTLSELMGRRVLSEAIQGSEDDNPHSRRVIHQATGVLLAQLDVPADDALLILQAHAYSTGRSMKDLARDVVAGEVRFERRASGIEVVT